MTIDEIIKLTEIFTIGEIAESLKINEQEARLALKLAGCYRLLGEKPWRVDEDINPLKLKYSIYHYHKKAKFNL